MLEKEIRGIGDQRKPRYLERMGKIMGSWSPAFWYVLVLSFALVVGPGAQGWSKEGHIMTCRIAQVIHLDIYYPIFSARFVSMAGELYDVGGQGID